MISKIPPDEVDCLFKTHAEFTANIRTLPLAPLVQNIDRLRSEYNPNQTTIERSTRDWAESLVDEHGKSLKCDVENGGSNRAVQLLVPKDKMPMASSALRAYKKRISPFNQREIGFSDRVNSTHPTAIIPGFLPVSFPLPQSYSSLLPSLTSPSYTNCLRRRHMACLPIQTSTRNCYRWESNPQHRHLWLAFATTSSPDFIRRNGTS